MMIWRTVICELLLDCRRSVNSEWRGCGRCERTGVIEAAPLPEMKWTSRTWRARGSQDIPMSRWPGMEMGGELPAGWSGTNLI